MTTDEENEFQGLALIRRKFNDLGIGYVGVWRSPGYTKGALAIINSGIFSKKELISSTGKKYAVDIDYLLFTLVRTALDYDIVFLHSDILRETDELFERIGEIAYIAKIGLPLVKRIEKNWQDFRKEVSTSVCEGKVPPLWRYIVATGEKPEPKAHRLVKIFLEHVPLETPATHLTKWTNSVLQSLGLEPVADRTLREYISKEKQKLKDAPKFMQILK